MAKYIHGVLSTVGLVGIYGTFGASDSGSISDTRCFVQALFFMVIFVVFGILAKKKHVRNANSKRANRKNIHLRLYHKKIDLSRGNFKKVM